MAYSTIHFIIWQTSNVWLPHCSLSSKERWHTTNVSILKALRFEVELWKWNLVTYKSLAWQTKLFLNFIKSDCTENSMSRRLRKKTPDIHPSILCLLSKIVEFRFVSYDGNKRGCFDILIVERRVDVFIVTIILLLSEKVI